MSAEHRLHGTLSLQYEDVSIYGNRHGLARLAAWLKAPDGRRVQALDPPPPALRSADDHPLKRLIVEPDGGLLKFRVDGDDLVLSGDQGEIARVVGGSVEHLAASSSTSNGIPRHTHLDPRIWPEYWAQDSVAEVTFSYDDGVQDAPG
jgi:hypothetical protein